MLLLPASLCGNGMSGQRGSSDESFGWDFFVCGQAGALVKEAPVFYNNGKNGFARNKKEGT